MRSDYIGLHAIFFSACALLADTKAAHDSGEPALAGVIPRSSVADWVCRGIAMSTSQQGQKYLYRWLVKIEACCPLSSGTACPNICSGTLLVACRPLLQALMQLESSATTADQHAALARGCLFKLHPTQQQACCAFKLQSWTTS